jgi:phospholipase/carboxylesterase
MTSDLSFIHRYEKATRPGAKPLLLLHGTGGNEDDLVPLGRMVAPAAALLSPRGKVLEHGMPRFFRRLAEGVFDEDDVRRRAHELADFVEAARHRYDIAAPVALGYSNGANIAAAVLLLRPQVLAGAVLLRAMVPFKGTVSLKEIVPRKEAADENLAGKPVLILLGARDPIAGPEHGGRLAAMLEAAGATVEQRTLPNGHELSQADVVFARAWLERSEAGAAARTG